MVAPTRLPGASSSLSKALFNEYGVIITTLEGGVAPAQAESVRVWEAKTPSKTKQCDASMRSAPTVTMALSNGIVLRRAIVATSVAALTIVSLHGADSSKPSASISVPTTSAVKPPCPRPSGNGMDTWRRVCNGQRRDMQRQVFVLTSEPHRCAADPPCEGERIWMDETDVTKSSRNLSWPPAIPPSRSALRQRTSFLMRRQRTWLLVRWYSLPLPGLCR